MSTSYVFSKTFSLTQPRGFGFFARRARRARRRFSFLYVHARVCVVCMHNAAFAYCFVAAIYLFTV